MSAIRPGPNQREGSNLVAVKNGFNLFPTHFFVYEKTGVIKNRLAIGVIFLMPTKSTLDGGCLKVGRLSERYQFSWERNSLFKAPK